MLFNKLNSVRFDASKDQGAGNGASDSTSAQGAAGSEGNPNATEPEVISKSDYEAAIQKYENDIRRLKSSADQRTAALERQYRESQSKLQEQLDALQINSLPEDQRGMKQSEINQRRLEEQLNAERAARENAETVTQYRDFFADMGVDPKFLNYSNAEDIVNNGWQQVKTKLASQETEIAQLRAKITELSGGKAPEGKAPQPNTQRANLPPTVGHTWKELIEKYGSEENVYSLVEQGALSPSVLPAEE